MRAFAGKTAVHGASSRAHRASVSNSSTAFTSCKGTTSPSLSFARPRLTSLAEARRATKDHARPRASRPPNQSVGRSSATASQEHATATVRALVSATNSPVVAMGMEGPGRPRASRLQFEFRRAPGASQRKKRLSLESPRGPSRGSAGFCVTGRPGAWRTSRALHGEHPHQRGPLVHIGETHA
jgi:hypothetical protein